MSDEEREHIARLEDRLDEQTTILTEIRIAVARLESRGTCVSPGLCVSLQKVLDDHERRLASIERLRAWSLGVSATVSLIAFVFWDVLKLTFKKP